MLLLKNAKLHTVLNGTIDSGDILIDNGVIVEVAVGICMTYGLSFDAALRAVTINPAKLLGIDDIGAIAVGYRAELAVFAECPSRI